MLRDFDWVLFLLVLALLAAGVACVGSAAWDARSGATGGLLVRQACWAALGLGLFFAVLLVPYRQLERWAYLLYGLGLVLLLVVFLMPARQGARRWIPLGPLNLQPSEPAKLFLVLALARYLKHRDLGRFSALLPVLGLVLVAFGLVARQPDLGSALVLVPLGGALLWAAGARKLHLLALVLAAANLLPLGWRFLRPYQRQRLETFVNRERLSREQRLDQAYQAIQAEIAVGSGGVFGKGWRKGTMNRYRLVPDRHNDFIFCVVAEEWGLVGSSVLLALYGLLIAICLGVAESAKDPFGRLLAVGVGAMLGTQVVTHVAISLQLFPVTGLTLPLVSYGGTSLVTCMVGLGLVMNVRVWRVRN